MNICFSNSKDISVIVPIYKHWHLVHKLIEALNNQSFSKDRFEIIFVNNDPSSPPPNNLIFPSNSVVLNQFIPGSYSARNLGVEKASGELLAFTDADCIPDRKWLESLWEFWVHSNKLVLIAGDIIIKSNSFNKTNIIELYEEIFALPQSRYILKGYAVTANLAIPKSVFNNIGLFDHHRFSGADAEFCKRASAQGITVSFCPESYIIHPARSSIIDLFTKHRRRIGGQLKSGNLTSRLKYCIGILIVPLRDSLWIFYIKKISFNKKMMLFALNFALILLGILEGIRLLLGGKAERR